MVQNFATMVFSVEHSSYRLSVGESFVKTGLFSCRGVSVREICCCVCLIVGSLLWSHVLVKHFVNLLWERCFIKQTLLTDFLQHSELLTLLPVLQHETFKNLQTFTELNSCCSCVVDHMFTCSLCVMKGPCLFLIRLQVRYQSMEAFVSAFFLMEPSN